ncbi:MAG: hypothetical protein HOP12_10960 [Candidatus Eisenbacteria bacterium]|uniref:LamG domain-containing protein n=1 Tax=Eiseniibacteriota bacterium TaxID=2212470 RepID=A0A849SLP0_UNCEI|nr:hypothetical protein [Candidatus Eisenbacteria bacterium]
MRLARASVMTLMISVALAASAHAATFAEHVTGGVLDLVWVPGFGISNTMQPLTLAPSNPAYANPSGDHTVAVATNSSVPDSGGVILTATDPMGLVDYTWEGWFFTGDGNTRRGLVLRADPSNGFGTCYQFVIQSGLFQINFRKLVNSAPTTLGTWFANTLPGGVPTVNTWHHMKVIALGDSFRCFFDGAELTTVPIVDNSIPTGWVGAYNFRFDLGGVPVYFDDLTLTGDGPTPARHATWGNVKSRWR